MAANCPVIGTTTTTLPPSHPEINLDEPGQTCPVVGATTNHHAHLLHKHPKVPIPSDVHAPDEAVACPVLKQRLESDDKTKAMDDSLCPVVGTATTVLPPDHPALDKGEVCPVTKATVKHHKEKVHGHPDLGGVDKAAVCPVAGKTREQA